MASKQKTELRASQKFPTEDWEKLIRDLLLTLIHLENSGGKLNMSVEGQWQVWRGCRQMAAEPQNKLAHLFAAPAFATIPLIGDLLSKTEIALKSRSLSSEHRRHAEFLMDRLDFALALICRNFCSLISYRGRKTRNSDLFCEALLAVQGDCTVQAQMIRRCVEHFPDELVPGCDNIVEMFAWETYRRVEELDRLADEFPAQMEFAAKQMHGWPMLRQRHHDNRARFEILVERLNLGVEYPLDTSRKARFRPDSPMVRFLDPLIYRIHRVYGLTLKRKFDSIEAENNTLRRLYWESSEDTPGEDLLAVLRIIRRLPPLTKATAKEWTKKVIIPVIMIENVKDYRECKVPALAAISRQKGVKSVATFKSRLQAAVVPTLKSMARPG